MAHPCGECGGTAKVSLVSWYCPACGQQWTLLSADDTPTRSQLRAEFMKERGHTSPEEVD